MPQDLVPVLEVHAEQHGLDGADDIWPIQGRLALNVLAFDLQGQLYFSPRLTNVENVTMDHETRLTAAEAAIVANIATLTDHETRIDAAEALGTLHTSTLGDHETRIDTLEAFEAAALPEIADHENRLDAIEAAWVVPAFNATDFTTSGAGTWTVALGDVIKFKYKVIGKMMFIQLGLATTSVTRSGGDPVLLRVAIPGGHTAATNDGGKPHFVQDNGVYVEAFMLTSADGLRMEFQRFDSGQWATSVNNTAIGGSFFFEVA